MTMTAAEQKVLWDAYVRWNREQIQDHGEPELIRTYPAPDPEKQAEGQYNQHTLAADATAEQEQDYEHVLLLERAKAAK